MVTTRFDYICSPFTRGLLDKNRALNELDFSEHQRARLKESIATDVRKLGDMLIPDARYPRVSVAAAERAAAIGVDLRRETWHSQAGFDPKRAVFHYEHMNPVGQIVNAMAVARSVSEIVQILSDRLQVAWITKDEDARLTALGYRQKRPDAAGAYAKAGIALLPSLPDHGQQIMTVGTLFAGALAVTDRSTGADVSSEAPPLTISRRFRHADPRGAATPPTGTVTLTH